MHTAIVLLSLGMALAVATGSLADHADLITGRNLAADRAERAASVFVQGCGSQGCDASTVNRVRNDGTVLNGCVNAASSGAVLRVEAGVPWSPRVFAGLTPAFAVTAIDLGGLSASATRVLAAC